MRYRRDSCARTRHSTGSIRDRLSGMAQRIVANAALDLARRRKVRNAEELSESIPTLSAIRRRVASCRERLEAALVQLPDRARSVIVLHDIEGFTHAEIERCWVYRVEQPGLICTMRDRSCGCYWET